MMDLVSGLWSICFCGGGCSYELPFGVRTEEQPEKGHAPSAPRQPYLWRKIATTTVIAGILCALINLVITSGWISLGVPSG